MRNLFKLTLPVALGLLCALSQTAGAATKSTAPSIKWGHSIGLVNPAKAGAFNAVSCAVNTVTKPVGAQLCVAADNTGNIWWSNEPWKSRAHWKRVTIDTVKNASLTGVSCPTTSFCVVVDNQGDVISSKDPEGGAKEWGKPVKADPTQAVSGGNAGFSGISCVSTALCVGVDNASGVVTSTNPTGPATAWTISAIPAPAGATSPVLTSVSCASLTRCVVAGSNRYYAFNPTGGVSAWHSAGGTDGVLQSIQCVTVKLCVAVGYGDTTTGLASATATPTGPATGWINTTINTTIPTGYGGLLDSVSCPGVGFCVAVDGGDNAYDSVSPLTGVWTAITSVRQRSASTWSAVSCDYKNCVVVDSRGFLTAGTVANVAAPTAAATTTTTTGTTTSTTSSTSSTTSTGN